MSERKKYALVVAGGKGLRMAADVPKQFLLLKGKPVLMHTVSGFFAAGCEVILVLPEQQIDYWKELCDQHAFTIPHAIVAGGAERFDSVKNGLEAVAEEEALVAIHDGVRPCVTQEIIRHSFRDAEMYHSSIVAVKLKDSIRMVKEHTTVAADRNLFYLVQTPQTFIAKEIKQAYTQPYSASFTDDASVFEAAGNEVHLTAGDYRNIKITTAEDLDLAALFLT